MLFSNPKFNIFLTILDAEKLIFGSFSRSCTMSYLLCEAICRNASKWKMDKLFPTDPFLVTLFGSYALVPLETSF